MVRSRVTLLTLALMLLATLAVPARAAQIQATTPVSVATLPDLTLKSALPTIVDDRGFVLGGIGSGLWRGPTDEPGTYWMVTDRGPNAELDVDGNTRRTFPVPDFTPLILKVQTQGAALTVTQAISITGTDGKGVSGLSNLPTKDEAPFNFNGTVPISYNQSGLDTEGIVRLSTGPLSGTFFLADEYRPSLVHVGANGQVIRRYIPATVALTATYPVSATLPAIFDKRRQNRGFEGIALSPDQSTLFLVLQSPLQNPDIATARTSRNSRILAFDIASQTVTAEYVYRMEDAATFDVTSRFFTRPQNEMKLSGLIALDNSTLAVLERTDAAAKIFRVSLTGPTTPTNILGTVWDTAATSPTLEQQTDLTAASPAVVPLPKTLLADLEALGFPDKIEGIAQIDADTFAAANDNDFDINATTGLPNTPRKNRSRLLTFDLPQAIELPNRVAAGDVTTATAVLWARASAPGTLTFSYGTDAALASGTLSTTLAVTDVLIPARLAVSGLAANTQYYYRATDAAGATSQGRFRTPAATVRKGLRFGVTGDWRGELSPYPAISNAAGRDLDFFVEHGDTIYADYASPDVNKPQAQTITDYRLKHNEVYSTRALSNTWGDLRSSTAMFATIDDHEVTNDFAGGASCATDPRFTCPLSTTLINNSPLFQTGLQAFQEFNPLVEEFYGTTGDPRTAGQRKLYRARNFGTDAAIFVLDARSFRDTELPGLGAADVTSPTLVGQFLAATFVPTRTMLGAQQLSDVQRDLLAAERAGVTWKFVLIPEPIQNLGVLAASDRFEGYAAERTRLLRFINQQGIRNVVFVAADIHGTLVNNLTYQLGPGQPQIATAAFEISTGSAGFDAPFGPTVFEIAKAAGILPPGTEAFYNATTRAGKDEIIRQLTDAQLAPLGYEPLGLQGSPISATLAAGSSYVSTHTYGWTEFEIGATQTLTVTTYGIDSYTVAQAAADGFSLKDRVPAVVSQFTVNPAQAVQRLPLLSR